MSTAPTADNGWIDLDSLGVEECHRTVTRRLRRTITRRLRRPL